MLAAPAWAQTKAAQELPTVTIISDPNDPRSNLGSAYVVTEKELERFEHSNVHSVLNKVPGVYVREEDGMGTFPRIGIRASSSGRSDRISIMEDGVPAAMAPYANTSAYYFPTIGRMSSVEVLKGPEVLLYGPQTTSGAINLLSTPIPEAASGFVNVEIGQNSTRQVHAHYGATIGQWGILVETFQRDTDGFHNIDRSSRTAGTDVGEYMAKLRWRSAPDARFRQQVDLKLFKGDEKADVSYMGLTDADFKANPDRRYGLSELERMSRGRESIVLGHMIELDDSSLLRTTLYQNDTYRYYRRLNQVNGVNLGGITSIINNNGPTAALMQGILDGTADTTHANGVRYGLNEQSFISRGVQLEWIKPFQTGALAHELSVAARLHEDEARNADKRRSNSIYQQVNGSLVFDQTLAAPRSTGEAKAQAYWIADRMTFGSWTVMPVVRHERIRTKANLVENATPAQIAARQTNSIDKTLPGLGVNYALGERWTLLAGIHEGFAPPGNGAVKGSEGEESLNIEAGVRYRQGAFGMDAIAFHSDYKNALRNCMVANPCASGAVDGTEQAGAKDVYGLELGIFAELYRSAALSVPVRLAYTYTDGEHTRDSDVAGGVRKGDVLDYTPKHAASLQVGVEAAAGWKTYAALNYIDDTCTTTTCGRPGVDTRFLKTENLFTTDLGVSVPLTSDVDLFAKVTNVFDERAITHRGADGARGNPGRYTGVGLRAKF